MFACGSGGGGFGSTALATATTQITGRTAGCFGASPFAPCVAAGNGDRTGAGIYGYIFTCCIIALSDRYTDTVIANGGGFVHLKLKGHQGSCGGNILSVAVPIGVLSIGHTATD